MARILAVTACPTGIAHSLMAAEALRTVGTMMGHQVKVECQGAESTTDALDERDLAGADVVILAADIHVEAQRFGALPLVETSTSRAIRDTKGVLAAALERAGKPAAGPAAAADTAGTAPPVTADVPVAAAAPNATPSAPGRRIVAITACPTGIAHTFMAAEALKRAAAARGHEIHIETQGSVGAKNQLAPEDIAAADVVVIAADTHVDDTRFAGKRVYKTSVGSAVKRAADVLDNAFAAPAAVDVVAPRADAAVQTERRPGVYKHLLTGVSYMLPIVVAGGLCVALSFVFGIDAFRQEGSLAAALMQIGSGTAFKIMVPVLAGYIAFSIADRPGLAPGLIGGMLAADLQAGFLGGIAAGFVAGYAARWTRDLVALPVHLEGLKPVLVIPLLATLLTGLTMIYVVGTPVRFLMATLTTWLQGMGSTNAVLLGLLLGGMMAVDLGGPVNKSAYTFAIGLLTAQTYAPMAAVMAAGMTPPLGLALATFLARNRFGRDEREAGKVSAVLGLAFVTEGAIPFAAKDPKTVLPACVAGSAVAGALSMLFGVQLRVPHGGVFVLAIPHAVTPLGPYAVAIVAGTAVTAAVLVLLRKPVEQPSPAAGVLAGA